MANYLGSKIREIRLLRKLTVTELATQSSLAKSYISYIERHPDANPSIDVLERICGVLQVDIQTILNPESKQAYEWEWLVLIRHAESCGVTKQQFREFIERKTQSN